MATRRTSLGHRDLATHPGAGLLDRVTGSQVLRPSRLEPFEDVLRARCRPQGEELVIRIGEGPTTADRHETRVAVFREDHTQHPSTRNCPTPNTMFPAPAFSATLTKQTSIVPDLPHAHARARLLSWDTCWRWRSRTCPTTKIISCCCRLRSVNG